MLEIGSVLDGKYKILNEIGHGGMSVVYLALNERANKTWAVKEVRKDGGTDSEVVSQGLVAETEMLKKLNHPNLPSIIDVIDKSDTFIIVMDYIEGKSLQSVLNYSGAQNPEMVLEWCKQLCDVLGYLHSRQPAIIYRDMKPSNVMLRPDGQVMLIDFGTAREYKEHSQGDTTWLGTRGYAAPEQFGGRGQTDGRTDIYCLGATMYHLLTGYSPADTQFVIHPLGQLVPSLSGSGLEKIVAKCCEPDPADRYQNCAELMYALEHVHDEDNAAVRARNKKWRTFIACCCVALAGIVGMASFGILKASAISHSYDSFLKKGDEVSGLEAKAANYGTAISLRPAEEAGYMKLLTAMTDQEGDQGQMITQDENQLLVDTIQPYQDIFSRKNHSKYLNFQYTRAMNYFNYYTGSKKTARTIFDQIKDDDDLDEAEKNISECLSLLCQVYILNSERSVEGENLLADHVQNNKVYQEAWEKLKEIAIDPTTIDEKTGEQFFSAMIYKEIASLINNNSVTYQNLGVGIKEMEQMLSAGARYVDSFNPNAASNQETRTLVSQAKEEITQAEHMLKQDKKKSSPTGSVSAGQGAADGQ